MITKIIKCLGTRLIKIIVVILLIVFIPNLPPNIKISEPFSLVPTLPLEGKLALNEKLNNVELLFKGKLHGPEGFAIYNGELYTAVHGGDVVKIVGNNIIPVVKFGKPCKGIYQEHICGRPLGLVFDKNGALYVVDAYYGIFKVDVKTGKYEQLISVDKEIANKKPKIPNALALASNGDIYWTDSSTELPLHDGLYTMLADGSGRVLHYDAKTKKNTVLLEKIHFTNGIILSKDESFLIISESARNRLLRYYLKGPKKGTSDVFLDGLPGVPDNLQPDGQGGFLAPLAVPIDDSDPTIPHALRQFPLARKFVARILGIVEAVFKFVDRVYPNEWAEKSVHFIGSFQMMWYIAPIPKRLTILHLSESGHIIDSLHALDGKITAVSDAIVLNDFLYLGSPVNDFLARVPLSQTGLKHLATVKKPDVPKVAPTQTTTPKPATTKPPTKAPSTTTPAPATTLPPTTPPPPKATESPTTTKTSKTAPSVEERKPTTQPPPASTTQKPTTSEAPPTTKAPVKTDTPPTTKPATPSTTKVPEEKPKATTPPPNKAKPETKQSESKTNKESKEKK